MGRVTISEKWSRSLYVVELVIFALIPAVALAAWIIFAGLVALFGLLFSIPMLPASILFDLPQTPKGMLQLLVLSGAIASLTGMGATALVKFVSLSAAFVRHGAAELREHRETFWRGLALAALPLIATNALLPGLTTEMIDERASRIFSYGLTLGVPLLHLWAEMHYRRKT
ncbi:hypothetical protein [Sinorhizobium arboris]|uniref:hypothetical protein n=1 Tax=Sinorhizobium arboris TaxID=76745 RepID=UPI0012431C8A|nr:hypothetical protein [Sinorhizobium arboris]